MIELALAADLVTNGQFNTNVNSWNEVETLNPANGATSWYATGYANGGAVRGATISGNSIQWGAYNNQTISTTIYNGSTVSLNFWWMGTQTRSPVKFNLTVTLKRPDASVVSLWSRQGNPTAWTTWYNVNTDVSSYFNQDGTYELRLGYLLTSASSGPGSTVTGYYDEVVLDVLAPDRAPPNMTLISPVNGANLSYRNVTFSYNVTDNSTIANCSLFINGILNMTNVSINTSRTNNFTVNNFVDGFYNWSVRCIDNSTFKNTNMTINWSLNIDATVPIVNLMTPLNNTLNATTNIILFRYNVTDFSNIRNCSLIIDNSIVNTTTIDPVSKNTVLNFTHTLTSGQHNWSVNCTDYFNLMGSSNKYNITIAIPPQILSMIIDDYLVPANEIILSAGSTRKVYCTVVVYDFFGTANIANVSAKFHYSLNTSSQNNDNNTIYSNSSCSLNETTSTNKTFSCAFDVLYYANNGTWICNATAYNLQNNFVYGNTSSYIQALYAINLTDGIDFGNVESNTTSLNITANITNIGNMPVNISLRGYAVTPGDNLGMNCTSNKNITISNIKFSTVSTLDFPAKTAMTGAVQTINLRIAKQTNPSIQIINNTYWQIQPGPGIKGNNCSGFIMFNAQIS
jgi:hypothetical protein